jgi:hypothetical protein
MNKTQLEYAVRRLDRLYSDKAALIRDANQKKNPEFDSKQFVAAVKSGKLKLSDRSLLIDEYTYVASIFTNLKDFVKPRNLKDMSKPQYAAIEAEYNWIKDQLYLGDAKEALALIEAFAAKKF